MVNKIGHQHSALSSPTAHVLNAGALTQPQLSPDAASGKRLDRANRRHRIADAIASRIGYGDHVEVAPVPSAMAIGTSTRFASGPLEHLPASTNFAEEVTNGTPRLYFAVLTSATKFLKRIHLDQTRFADDAFSARISGPAQSIARSQGEDIYDYIMRCSDRLHGRRFESTDTDALAEIPLATRKAGDQRLDRASGGDRIPDATACRIRLRYGPDFAVAGSQDCKDSHGSRHNKKTSANFHFCNLW